MLRYWYSYFSKVWAAPSIQRPLMEWTAVDRLWGLVHFLFHGSWNHLLKRVLRLCGRLLKAFSMYARIPTGFLHLSWEGQITPLGSLGSPSPSRLLLGRESSDFSLLWRGRGCCLGVMSWEIHKEFLLSSLLSWLLGDWPFTASSWRREDLTYAGWSISISLIFFSRLRSALRLSTMRSFSALLSEHYF